MLFNNELYNFCINAFEKNIEHQFDKDMRLIVKTSALLDKGSFLLSYEYIPLNYIITIENEMRTFDITIEDKEKASTPLGRIKKFESGLNEKNIYNAVRLLKDVLVKNNFDLYVYIDDKVYIKNKNGIKRVRIV